MNIPLRKILLILLILPATIEYAIAEDIGALGYIAPEYDIIKLTGNGAIIQDILVKQNQVVKAGESLVVLSTDSTLQDNLLQAEMLLDNHLKVTEKVLKLQEVAVSSAIQKDRQAKQSLDNYQKLPSSSRSSNELLLRKNTVDNAKSQVRIANATLSKIKAEAEAETRLHNHKIDLAKSALDPVIIKATSSGTILSVMKHPGEPSSGIILTMADLNNMMVKSEVFENDILKISIGTSSTIKSNAIPEDLHGTIYLISNEVNPKNKVSNVYIRLEKASPANRMVGMEVNVNIHID
jgi:HlyD family secretion protein